METVTTLSKKAGVTRQKIYYWIRQGIIKPRRFGSVYVISREQCKNFMEFLEEKENDNLR